MPIHKVGKNKWQWGKSGKIYTTKKAAIRQMKAIYSAGYKKK